MAVPLVQSIVVARLQSVMTPRSPVMIGGGNLDADTSHVGSDDSIDALLDNSTMVVLADDHLGGTTIWPRPKHW
jgi:hypothetical protein